MAYEMVMPYHLHMPSYFLETFTEYPILSAPDNVSPNTTISPIIWSVWDERLKLFSKLQDVALQTIRYDVPVCLPEFH